MKLIGTLDYATGDVFCVQELQYKAVEFLNFLKNFIARYPNKHIAMVLGNACIHHAKLIKPFLEKHQEPINTVNRLCLKL